MPIDPKVKKPLAPKVIKTHPYEPIWAALERMGHRPLPSIAKHPPLMDWPRVPTDAKARSHWPLRARDKDTGEWRDVGAGIQMVDGLLVFDVDVTDLIWRSIATETIEEIAPGTLEQMVARHSGAASIALFARTEAGFKTLAASRGYAETEGGDRVARVELFAGAIAKHVATHGPHAKPGREYGYLGNRLEDVAIVDLPLVTQAQAWAILKRVEEKFDEVLVRHGDRIETGDSLKRVYDLEPGMIFRLEDGEDVELTELQERLTEKGLYGYATLWDPTSDRKDRAKAVSASSGLMIIDWHTMIGHCWKHLAPPSLEDLAVGLKAIKDRQDGGAGGGSPPATPAPPASSSADLEWPQDPPPPPDDAAQLNEKALWLTLTRGYCEIDDAVVQLYEPSDNCQSTRGAFKARFAAWSIPINQVKREYASELWMHSPARRNLAGVRMAPTQGFPLYVEDGQLYKNTYRPPAHDAPGGDEKHFVEAFLPRFIPDQTEREHFIRRLAHKRRHPEVPGPAIVFVADTPDEIREGAHGTGRGQLFRIAHMLYGEQYARPQDFNVVDGSSSQSQFTDWMHHCLLATIDEAKTSATAYRKGERSAVYEVLKNIVEVAPKRRSFKKKNKQSFEGWSYCSIWIASNHADALAIPSSDRRFTILTNGAPMTPEEGKALADWITPANVAALARWLDQVDLTGFNIYACLQTAAKAEMAQLAISPLEEVMRELVADPERGLVFPRECFMRIARGLAGDDWSVGEASGVWNRITARVYGPDRRSQRRVKVGATRLKMFCARPNVAAAEALPEAALRRESAKWGFGGPVPGPQAASGATAGTGEDDN